jgi:hypothetical protein
VASLLVVGARESPSETQIVPLNKNRSNTGTSESRKITALLALAMKAIVKSMPAKQASAPKTLSH